MPLQIFLHIVIFKIYVFSNDVRVVPAFGRPDRSSVEKFDGRCEAAAAKGNFRKSFEEAV